MNDKPPLILRFNSFELIPDEWVLRRNGKEITLTPQDFKVLCCLADKAPNIVDRQDSLSAGWGKSGDANYLDGSVYRLRMILGRKSIRTIRGVGHKLMPKVVRQTARNLVRDDVENGAQEQTSKSVTSSWLYSDHDLAQIEAQSNGNSIWIISPDLANVTGKDVIIDAVEKNIKRGITYTYIVPESDIINGVLPGLMSLFKSAQRQLRLAKIPEAQFRLLSVTHVAIFNTDMDGRQYPEVYMELPIEEDGNRIRGHWIKVAKDPAKSLVGRFRPYAEAAEWE